MNNFYFFETIRKFIIDDVSLDEEKRKRYLNLLDKIEQNQKVDYEEAYEFVGYIEDIFDEAEEIALIKKDSEAIKVLAEARQERNLIMTLLIKGEEFIKEFSNNKINQVDSDQAEIEKLKQTLQQQATT